MTNGKKTHISLQLMLDRDHEDNYKTFKLNQISNQVITLQDFFKMTAIRKACGVPELKKDFIFMKQYDLKQARNYIYRDGELD